MEHHHWQFVQIILGVGAGEGGTGLTRKEGYPFMNKNMHNSCLFVTCCINFLTFSGFSVIRGIRTNCYWGNQSPQMRETNRSSRPCTLGENIQISVESLYIMNHGLLLSHQEEKFHIYHWMQLKDNLAILKNVRCMLLMKCILPTAYFPCTAERFQFPCFAAQIQVCIYM